MGWRMRTTIARGPCTMARTVADTCQLLGAQAGFDAVDPLSHPLDVAALATPPPVDLGRMLTRSVMPTLDAGSLGRSLLQPRRNSLCGGRRCMAGSGASTSSNQTPFTAISDLVSPSTFSRSIRASANRCAICAWSSNIESSRKRMPSSSVSARGK